MPTWTPLDENNEIDEELHPTLDALAAKWTRFHNEAEQKMFSRQAMAEEGRDYMSQFDGEDDEVVEQELARYKKKQAAEQAAFDVEIEVIEGLLARYGARMMRPYEHHREDERLMEYLENRYDY